MRRLLPVSLLMCAITLGVLAPTALAADAPGTSPTSALAIAGTMQGTLAPQQVRWYQFVGDGSSPMGVTMDYQPTDNPLGANVYFNVDWTGGFGQQNIDWPGYFRVGQGTSSGLSAGRRYWFTSAMALATYDVQVVNSSNEPIGYALALTGPAFPPASLNAPPPGAPTASAAPAAPAAPPAAPHPPVVAQAPPSGPANTATDQSGLILDPKVTIDGPFSTVTLHVDSNSLRQIRVYRVMIRPPDGAVVDGVSPSQSLSEDGIAWYAGQLVDQADPMTGYSARFYGPANGAVVEIDWATSNDNGALSVTISGAPNPAPVGQ